SLYSPLSSISCFFFTAPSTTVFYTLSLHDALPISPFSFPSTTTWAEPDCPWLVCSMFSTSYDHLRVTVGCGQVKYIIIVNPRGRSEEHTSELQSRENLVCRLLLEKKKIKYKNLQK